MGRFVSSKKKLNWSDQSSGDTWNLAASTNCYGTSKNATSEPEPSSSAGDRRLRPSAGSILRMRLYFQQRRIPLLCASGPAPSQIVAEIHKNVRNPPSHRDVKIRRTFVIDPAPAAASPMLVLSRRVEHALNVTVQCLQHSHPRKRYPGSR